MENISFYYASIQSLLHITLCVCNSSGQAAQEAVVVRDPPANARDMRPWFDPGLGRSPGGEHAGILAQKSLEGQSPYGLKGSGVNEGTWQAGTHAQRNRQELLAARREGETRGAEADLKSEGGLLRIYQASLLVQRKKLVKKFAD